MTRRTRTSRGTYRRLVQVGRSLVLGWAVVVRRLRQVRRHLALTTASAGGCSRTRRAATLRPVGGSAEPPGIPLRALTAAWALVRLHGRLSSHLMRGRRTRSRRRRRTAGRTAVAGSCGRNVVECHALDPAVDSAGVDEGLAYDLRVLALLKGAGQAAAADAEQQTLSVVVEYLRVLAQEGPGGATDREDRGEHVGPGAPDRVGVDAPRSGPRRRCRVRLGLGLGLTLTTALQATLTTTSRFAP